MITSRVRNISPEAAMQLNNRIVHISVQLFSGVDHAYRMVKEKSLHYIIVKGMGDMFARNRTVSDILCLIIKRSMPLIFMGRQSTVFVHIL